MSDKSSRGFKFNVFKRINRLLNHAECSQAIMFVIQHCEELLGDEIRSVNQDFEYPILSEKVLSIHSGNYDSFFFTEKMQSFLKYLSDNPDLANHFCDLLFLKYLPQCGNLRKVG